MIKCKCILETKHDLIKKGKYYYCSIFINNGMTYTQYIYECNESVMLLEIYRKDEFDDMFIGVQEERKLKLEKINESR